MEDTHQVKLDDDEIEQEIVNPSSEAPVEEHEHNKISNYERIKKIVVSGVGFFSDSYDIFVINMCMVILEQEYGKENVNKGWISSAVLIGAIVGQLTFGYLADRIGRRKGFIATLTLVISGAILSCCAFNAPPFTITISLALFRFLLGIGIGGEYPLSATITSESSEARNRGRNIATVFSMQGIGSLTAAGLTFLLVLIFQDSWDAIWRIALGVGCVPGLLTMYFRVKMEETHRFAQSKSENKISFAQSFKKYWLTLLGTAGTWFLLDITFYANGLFSASVLKTFEAANPAQSQVLTVLTTAQHNVYLALMALPGYWVGVWLIELRWMGRKNTQTIGFLLLAALYFILAATWEELQAGEPWLFLLMYGATFFITNAGPNTTTFVLPSESFPTNIRATYHGISAACGKLGAAVGANGIALLQDSGLDIIFIICGCVALSGAILTVIAITETKGKTLEQIELDIVKPKFSGKSTPEPDSGVVQN